MESGAQEWRGLRVYAGRGLPLARVDGCALLIARQRVAVIRCNMYNAGRLQLTQRKFGDSLLRTISRTLWSVLELAPSALMSRHACQYCPRCGAVTYDEESAGV